MFRHETPVTIAEKLNIAEITDIFVGVEWTDHLEQEKTRKRDARKTATLTKQNSFAPWSSPTQLPAVPLKNKPSTPTESKPPAIAPKPPPRKQITDPVVGNWKKAPIPDELRDAMLKLIADTPPEQQQQQQQPSSPSNPQNDIAKQLIKEASEKAMGRQSRMQTTGVGHSNLAKSSPVRSADRAEELKVQIDNFSELLKGRTFRRVLWDIEPDEEDELRLNSGDIVEVIKEDDSGWWTGCCRGKIGTFPSNYTEQVDQLENKTLTPRTQNSILNQKEEVKSEDAPIDENPVSSPPLEVSNSPVTSPVMTPKKEQIKITEEKPVSSPATPEKSSVYSTPLPKPPQRPKTIIEKPSVLRANTAPTEQSPMSRNLPTLPQRGGAGGNPRGRQIGKTASGGRPSSQVISRGSPGRQLPNAPSNLNPSKKPNLTPISGGGKNATRPKKLVHAVVSADYNATDASQISLSKGSIVTVVDKNSADFWTVRSRDKEEGLFPASNLTEQLIELRGGSVRGPRPAVHSLT